MIKTKNYEIENIVTVIVINYRNKKMILSRERIVHFIPFIYLFVFCNITFNPHNQLQCFAIQN